jgi:hypothetical protein
MLNPRINELEDQVASLIEERDAWAFSANQNLKLYEEASAWLRKSREDVERLQAEVYRLEQLLSGK